MVLSFRQGSADASAVAWSSGSLRRTGEPHISQSNHDFLFVILDRVTASQTMHYWWDGRPSYPPSAQHRTHYSYLCSPAEGKSHLKSNFAASVMRNSVAVASGHKPANILLLWLTSAEKVSRRDGWNKKGPRKGSNYQQLNLMWSGGIVKLRQCREAASRLGRTR